MQSRSNGRKALVLGGTGAMGPRYQLAYDRLFARIIDNSKVLRVTGLKQEDFMPLRRGLEKELSALPKDFVWPDTGDIGQNMDEYVRKHG